LGETGKRNDRGGVYATAGLSSIEKEESQNTFKQKKMPLRRKD